MIEAPLNVLMRTIIPLLKADEALAGMIGPRVYDHVPDPDLAPYPYVSIGTAWETQDDADCLASVEIGFRLDVWSRAIGFPEARAIAHRLRSLLHDVEFDLSEGALAMLEHRRTDTMRDADGLTNHVSVEFSAVIEA